jgi:GNAT superfamily N-acetyltransferase
VTPRREAAPQRGYEQPRPISPNDDLSQFSSGQPALDDWLKRIALQAESRSARTYVVCHGAQVVGYYCLASGSVARTHLPSADLRRNTPDPVPVFVIGRLAVDAAHQNQRIGRFLLKDALLRAAAAADIIGAMAVIVHALDDQGAINFYLRNNFTPMPDAARTFLITMKTIKAAIVAAAQDTSPSTSARGP